MCHFFQSASHLQVAVAHGLMIQGDKLGRALLGHVHKVTGDGTSSAVDRSLPQDDQGVAPDLAEAQVVGRALGGV